MKKTLLMLTLLLLASQPAAAQKAECHNDGPQRGNCGESADTVHSAGARSAASISPSSAASISPSVAAIAPGPLPQPAPGPVTSPFPPETPTDRRFITNAWEGLDTGCTYRSGGPLKIEIPIKRVVGPTDGEGKLTDPDALIANGIFPKKYVTLSMPAYDVDVHGGPPEVDVVFFNGEELGKLTGNNGIWKTNTWNIPIDKVRFGIPNERGEPGEGRNLIEIRIDQASGSAENWCTSIDWAEITFEAMYPVVMIHGNNSSGSFWTTNGFVEPFKARHIPYDDTISLEPNANTIDAQSLQLMTLIKERAGRFGVDHLHLVAHSKGGLDTRDFLVRRMAQLRRTGEELGILSLTTLSTPHHGSVGADYVLDAKQVTGSLLDTGGGIWSSDSPKHTALAKLMHSSRAYPHLRTDYVKDTFNQLNRPPTRMTVKGETNTVHYFSVGADANANNSMDEDGQPTIGAEELDGIHAVYGWFNASTIPGVTSLTQTIYRLIGNVASTRLDTVTNSVLGPLWVVRENAYQDGFHRNDFLVTVDSAEHPSFRTIGNALANHASIARPDVAEGVIRAIRSANNRE